MITHEGIEYLTYSDLRPGCIYNDECKLLGQAEHNRDLFIRSGEPGFSIPAGKLENESSTPPFGTQVVSNKRGNLWWAEYNGKIVLVCLDSAIEKQYIKFPDEHITQGKIP